LCSLLLGKKPYAAPDTGDDVKLKIGSFGVNLHWLLTGMGVMFLSEMGDSGAIANNEIFLNKDSPHSVIGINNRVTMFP
ncbi:MAG: hypothetical protein LBB43_07320, partial [Spirochaetaceae bacterium]|nr:hypothetical protein [Spirochaetaceae bacterium]